MEKAQECGVCTMSGLKSVVLHFLHLLFTYAKIGNIGLLHSRHCN